MRKASIRNMLVTLILGVAFLLPSFRVEAAANPVIEFQSNVGLSGIVAESNAESLNCSKMPFKFLSLSTSMVSGNTIITVNKVDYSNSNVTAAERRSIMEVTLSAISNSNLSKQSKVRLYNFVAEQDTAVSSLVRQLSSDVSSDFATAYSYVKPFSGVIGTVLGVFSFAIFIFLAFMILADVSYLTIPAVRISLPVDENGKPKFVSNEAYTAVMDSEKELVASGTHVQVLGIYIKRKSWQIVLLAICIVYLVSGKIYPLVGSVIDAFSGILG